MGVEALSAPCPEATGKAWACVGRGLIVFPFLLFFLSLTRISEVMVGTPAAILDPQVRMEATCKEDATGREPGFLLSL